MTTKVILADNPKATMQNNAIEIKEGNHVLRFAANEIRSLCLRPRKNSYWSVIVGSVFFQNEKTYNLCIYTRDEKEFKIRIKAHEKQTYINLIAQVRRGIKRQLT